METQLKRNQNTLAVAGIGVAVFGFWSAIKSVMYCTLSPETIRAQLLAEMELHPDLPPISLELFRNVFYITMALVLLIDITIRVFIYISARAESRGKKKGYAYIFLTGAMIIVYIGLLAYSVSAFYSSTSSVADTIISMLIELTCIYTMFELMFSALKVKKLTKIRKE